ncbi:MAG: hypothetical protein Q9198_011402, partial [Flavoplaca austrocitrina]
MRLSLTLFTVIPTYSLQTRKGYPHRRATFTCRQSTTVMIHQSGVGDADLLDALLRAWQMGKENQQECTEDAESDGEKGAEGIHQSCNAREQWRGNRRGGDCRYEHVRQDVLIHELGLDFSLFAVKGERYTGQHPIAIEPVSISAQRFVDHRIASIPDILSASKVFGYYASIRAGNQGLHALDRGKVARQAAYGWAGFLRDGSFVVSAIGISYRLIMRLQRIRYGSQAPLIVTDVALC